MVERPDTGPNSNRSRDGPQSSVPEEHVAGSIPRSRRKLVVVLCALMGVLVIIGGLVANFATETSIRWPILLVAAGAVVVLFAVYLWVRLSD